MHRNYFAYDRHWNSGGLEGHHDAFPMRALFVRDLGGPDGFQRYALLLVRSLSCREQGEDTRKSNSKSR
ncbi:MAG: hypothetical protein ACTSWW_10205 [Promethearchaeota archaeon]